MFLIPNENLYKTSVNSVSVAILFINYAENYFWIVLFITEFVHVYP